MVSTSLAPVRAALVAALLASSVGHAAIGGASGERVAVVAVGDGAADVGRAVESAVAGAGFPLVAHGDVEQAIASGGFRCARADVDCWRKLAIVGGFDVVIVASAAGGLDPKRALDVIRVDANGAAPVRRSGSVGDLDGVVGRALHPELPDVSPRPDDGSEAAATGDDTASKPAPARSLHAAAPWPTTTWVAVGAGAVSLAALAGAGACEGVIWFHPKGYEYAKHFELLSGGEIALASTALVAAGLGLGALWLTPPARTALAPGFSGEHRPGVTTTATTERVRVIVLPVSGDALEPPDLATLAIQIVATLSEYPSFEVLSPNAVHAMSAFAGADFDGACTSDAQCVADVAKKLGAHVVVTAALSDDGARYLMRVTIRNTQDGVFKDSVVAGEEIEALAASVPRGVRTIAESFLAQESAR